MTFKTDDRVYETSVTTGTGTYTLDGAAVGFTTFAAQIGANNDCAYFATDDTNWEVGIGTVLTGPARLQRTTILRSSNADAAVNWGAGTRKIRCGLPAAMAVHRALSKSVAGSSHVTLTQDEQRRNVLVFTGALTGNINVIVDATLAQWTVYNNTTGAYTLTFKTSGGTGVAVTQGKLALLHCDGTNVLTSLTDSLYNDDEYTAASAACTGAITTAVVWKLTKIGNVVTLVLPSTQGSASLTPSFAYGTVIPSKYRPAADLCVTCPMINNAANQTSPGAVFVASASGLITVYRLPDFASNFSAGANCGLPYAFPLSWTI